MNRRILYSYPQPLTVHLSSLTRKGDKEMKPCQSVEMHPKPHSEIINLLLHCLALWYVNPCQLPDKSVCALYQERNGSNMYSSIFGHDGPLTSLSIPCSDPHVFDQWAAQCWPTDLRVAGLHLSPLHPPASAENPHAQRRPHDPELPRPQGGGPHRHQTGTTNTLSC